MNKFIKLVCISIFLIAPALAMQDVNDLGEQLIAAIQADDHEEVDRLIKVGAPVDYYADNYSRTALMHAAGGRLNCLQILIAAGAQVNLEDIYSSTALVRAAQSNHLPCFKALIAAGAQDNLAAQLSWTALTYAIINDNQTMCDLLINGMLWIPSKKQKAGMATLLGIGKTQKKLCPYGLDGCLRNQFKAVWRTTVYEDNKKNFASSVAYQELMRIKDIRPESKEQIEALLEKYNPGGNTSDSQSWCTVQ